MGLDKLTGPFDKFLINKHITDFGNIVSNQVVKAFPYFDGNLYEHYSDRLWMWNIYYYNDLTLPEAGSNPFEFFFYKLGTIFKAAFIYAIMSILSSIALHICLISIVVIYIFIGNSLLYS